MADTHVVLWLAGAPAKLSRKAGAAIHQAREHGQGLCISDMSLLELAILSHRGRIDLSISLESFLTEVEARFTVLPITGRICVRAMAFPSSFPKDPADRIIGATALIHGFPLITADKAIRSSKLLPTIW